MAEWTDFFIAAAGASAALAGLIFVAVSINLARILEFPRLPWRVAEALVALLSVLFISMAALSGGQSLRAAGAEIVVLATATWLAQTVFLVITLRDPQQRRSVAVRIPLNQAPPVTFLVGGVLLCAGQGGGLDWFLPATLLSFTAGIFGAWILLIEIQR